MLFYAIIFQLYKKKLKISFLKGRTKKRWAEKMNLKDNCG